MFLLDANMKFIADLSIIISFVGCGMSVVDVLEELNEAAVFVDSYIGEGRPR